MKLLSSPYSNSNSPSSSASFDPNVCTSQTATATCLITSILRRILCSRSLPSDHITSTGTDTDMKTNTSSHPIVTAAAASPGIVARLMGLDSNSSTPTRKIDHKHQQLSSKSSSLLEMPAFFELENDDFFLLTFDTREANSKRKTRARRRRRRTRKANENANEKAQLGCKEDKETEEDSITNLSRTKKKIISPCPLRIVEQEDCNSSQDLSPVSVLDFDQFLFDSPDQDCTIRRKLSSRLEDYSPLSTQIDDNSCKDDENSKLIEETCQRLTDNIYSHTQQHFNRQQGEICRLAEAQVVQLNWKFNDDVEDISADFGLGILDHLLEELVDQLYSTS